MYKIALVAAALAYAGAVNAQLPDNIPGCITRCAARKIQEGFCTNADIFTRAFNRCLQDNCTPANAQVGSQYAGQICAAASQIAGSASGSATQSAVVSSALSSLTSASAPPSATDSAASATDSAASATDSAGAGAGGVSASATDAASSASAAPSDASASASDASASATSSGAAPAPSASGNATEYAAGAVAALNGAGLTALAGALTSAAPPELLMQLMQGQHTVFAPNNEAIQALGPAAENSTALTALLSYHVLQGQVNSSSLQEGQKAIVRSSLKGQPYVNLPGNQSQVVVLTSQGGNQTVVEPTGNITAAGNATYQNLNLQVVPQALKIPGTLSETVANVSELSSLVQAANMASPNLLQELGQVQGLTIFAPTNDAFQSATQALEGANQTTIQNVLLNHIVNGTAVYSSLISPDSNVTSAGGQPFTFSSNDTGVFVSSGSATARVMTSDIIIQNGVVHTIDGILLNTESNPTAAEAAASSASSAGAQQTGTQTGPVTPQETAASAGQGGGSGGGGSGGQGGSGTDGGSAPSASANSFANRQFAPATGVSTGLFGFLALALFA